MAQPPPLPAAPPFPAFDWLVPGRGSAAGHCPSQRGLAHAHHAQDCISAARVRASPAARISLAQAPAPLWSVRHASSSSLNWRPGAPCAGGDVGAVVYRGLELLHTYGRERGW